MKYLSMMIVCAALLASCNRNDDFTGTIIPTEPVPTFDGTPLGQKQKQFFETYNVWFRCDYTHDDIKFDWNNSAIVNTAANVAGFRYSMPDKNYVAEVMDYVKTTVFDVLGAGFIKTHMPINLFMADTVCDKTVSGTVFIHYMWTGDIRYNHMMYGNVSDRFDALKGTREQAMWTLSLFVEKMIATGRISIPGEFALFSEAGYALLTVPYNNDIVKNYGFLRFSREGKSLHGATAAYRPMKIQQDFGDYVGFIVFMPDSEKEVYYAKNPAIKQKADVVQEVFRKTYGVTLPYSPIL